MSQHFSSSIQVSRCSDYNGSKPAYEIASKVSRLPRSIGAAQYDRNPVSGVYHSWEWALTFLESTHCSLPTFVRKLRRWCSTNGRRTGLQTTTRGLRIKSICRWAEKNDSLSVLCCTGRAWQTLRSESPFLRQECVFRSAMWPYIPETISKATIARMSLLSYSLICLRIGNQCPGLSSSATVSTWLDTSVLMSSTAGVRGNTSTISGNLHEMELFCGLTLPSPHPLYNTSQ